MSKRKRRTREEMLEFYRQKMEKLEAQLEGTYDDSQESNTLKRLKRALRKRQTAYKGAVTILEGVTSEDGKGWTRSPIAEKIEKTRARLAQQIETEQRSEEFRAKLPHDIQRLEALIEAAKIGEDVDFPSDLTPLGTEKTDEEHEAAAIVTDGENERD